jgi:hypothetical protein
MTVSLIGIPFAVYNNRLFSTAYTRATQSGNLVAAVIDWSQYPAGSDNPQFVVQVLFSSNANVPNGFKPLSLYINNLGSQIPIYVYFPDTGYQVTAPANSEGWYTIIANAPVAWIGGLNFQDNSLPITTIMFTDLLMPNYVNVATPQTLVQKLSSPAIGGGSDVSGIVLTVVGQSYTAGTLSVTGGGGSGVDAVGALDIWGRFTSVDVIASGENFLGPPVVTASASNAAAAAFNGAATYTVGEKTSFDGTEWMWNGSQSIPCGATGWQGYPQNYAAGSFVSYNGLIWQTPVVIPLGRGCSAGPSFPAPGSGTWQLVGSAQPNASYNWLNSGSAGGTTAQFQTTLSAPEGTISTEGIASAALGDQLFSENYVVSGNLTLDAAVFGSPFGSGFIYLTSIFASDAAVDSSACTYELALQTSDGSNVVFTVARAQSGDLINVSNCNIKLDATKTYQLVSTNHSGANGLLNIAIPFTISAV